MSKTVSGGGHNRKGRKREREKRWPLTHVCDMVRAKGKAEKRPHDTICYCQSQRCCMWSTFTIDFYGEGLVSRRVCGVDFTRVGRGRVGARASVGGHRSPASRSRKESRSSAIHVWVEQLRGLLLLRRHEPPEPEQSRSSLPAARPGLVRSVLLLPVR